MTTPPPTPNDPGQQPPQTGGPTSPQTPPPPGPTPPPPGTTPPGPAGGPVPQTPPPPGSTPPPYDAGSVPPQGHNPYANPSNSGVWTSQRPLTPAEERNLGMLSHVASGAVLVVSGGTLGWLPALVLYLLYRDRGPFVRKHTADSLNVQIITAIVLLISIPLTIVFGLGLLTGFLAFIFAVIVHIVGAVKANNGEWWSPPMTPTFVS